jgi:hypothetical protein
MGREEHRSSSRDEGSELVPEHLATANIDCCARLVEEQRRWAPRNGGGDRKPSSLTAGETADLPARQIGELEAFEQLVARDRVIEMRPHEIEKLRDAQHRRQSDLLQDDPDPASRCGLSRVATEEDRPTVVGPPEPEEERDGRRLAGAVRAEKPEDFALAELEIDVVQSADRPERLARGLEAGDCR